MSNLFYKLTSSTGGVLVLASIVVFLFISLVLGLTTIMGGIINLIPSSLKSWFTTNPMLGALTITGIICTLGALSGFIIWLIERRRDNGKTKFKWLA